MKRLIAQVRKNELECKILAKAYSIWLKTLAPANWLLVVGGALLSLIAGASLLVTQGIITKELAGILALISSAFTIIHTKLNCDQHQAECKKLKGIYRSLSLQYSNLYIESDPDAYKRKLQSLNEKRANIEENKDAEPSTASLNRARKLIGTNV